MSENQGQNTETKEVKKKAAKIQKRHYAGEGEIDHDLFQLKVADMLKNLGIDDPKSNSDPEYTKIPHTHFFHTVDSDGRPQTRSISIGGHCHEMKVIENPEGGVPTVVCGPAVREVRKKIKGKYHRVLEQISFDDHTHEVAYLRSNRIKKRETNVEATTVLAVDAQRTAPIPGIQG